MNYAPLLCLLLLVSSSLVANTPDTTRPNIIFVLTDDQGWGDVGYNGHPHITTPNIDAIAANGIRFNRFYAGASTCSPSRAAMLIGRANQRVNINAPMSKGQGSMPREEVTLPMYLRDNGYATAHFGKWHIGEIQDDPTNIHRYSPGMAGFDYWVSTRNVLPTRDPYTSNKYIDGFYWDNGNYISNTTKEALPERTGDSYGAAQIYKEDLEGDDSRIMMDQVLRYLDTRAGNPQPFFAHICLHAMHTPLDRQEETAPYYEALELDEATYGRTSLTSDEVTYYSNVTSLDAEVGKLRQKLVDLGIAENTMLWFMSDNGPNIKQASTIYTSPTDENFTYSKNGSSGPYRGYKRHLHEGGIRVPGVMEWPALVSSPIITDYPVGMIDLVPTLLDFLNIDADDYLQGDRSFDGISVRSVIEGNTSLRRSNPLPFKNDSWEAWIEHDYKIVRPKGSNTWELYHIENDPYETNDLRINGDSDDEDRFDALKAKYDLYHAEALAEQNFYKAKYPKGSLTGAVTPVQQWRMSAFHGEMDATGDAADLADPDQDNRNNADEYAFAGEGNRNRQGPQVIVSTVLTDDELRIEFPIHRSATDLIYKVQINDDLADDWTTTATYESSWSEDKQTNSKGQLVIVEILYDLTRTSLDSNTEHLSTVDGGNTSWSRYWIVTELLDADLMAPTGTVFARVIAEPKTN